MLVAALIWHSLKASFGKAPVSARSLVAVGPALVVKCQRGCTLST